MATVGPSYRAIPKARTAPSVGFWGRPTGRGSIRTSENVECPVTTSGALMGWELPGSRDNRVRGRGYLSQSSKIGS